MKKLIVMLAAGVLAVGANAAAIDWTAAKGYLYDGAETPEKITSGTAYLMLSAYSASSLVTAFVESNYDASKMVSDLQKLDQYLGSGTIGSNARISGTGTTSATDAITAYFVVFGDQGVYISDTATSQYDGLAQTHSLAFASISSSSKAFNDAKGGYKAAGWYGTATTDVPEPTSGLLMLVGLAGLALRRKRA